MSHVDASSIVPEPLHVTWAVMAVVGFDESIYFAAAFIHFFLRNRKLELTPRNRLRDDEVCTP